MGKSKKKNVFCCNFLFFLIENENFNKQKQIKTKRSEWKEKEKKSKWSEIK